MSATPAPVTPVKEQTREELLAIIAQLQAQAKQAPKAITVKASEKGGVSVYGLGRFPVTLYASQWERLNGAMADVMAFIAAHPELARKQAQ